MESVRCCALTRVTRLRCNMRHKQMLHVDWRHAPARSARRKSRERVCKYYSAHFSDIGGPCAERDINSIQSQHTRALEVFGTQECKSQVACRLASWKSNWLSDGSGAPRWILQFFWLSCAQISCTFTAKRSLNARRHHHINSLFCRRSTFTKLASAIFN